MYWYYIFVAILISIKVLVWIFICWYRTYRRQQQELYRANRIHQTNQVFVVQPGNPLILAFLKKKSKISLQLLEFLSKFWPEKPDGFHKAIITGIIFSTLDIWSKVDFLALCIAYTFFSPGKLIKKSELVLAWV